MTKGADIKKEKLKAIRERKRAILTEKATKVSPPVTGAEFTARIGDLSPANVARMSGLFSLQPWIGMCAIPLNLIPYRGCSNNCSYCFVNQMARGNIARKPGVKERKFYGTVDSLKPLEEMLQLSQGRRRLEDLPKGQRLHGWFFERRIPARLSALTDPFMKLEATRRKSYEILRLCKTYQYPVVINTKGGDRFDDCLDLVLSLPHKIVQISLISVDEEVVRDYEPNSPPVAQRLAAIKRLTDVGVYVSVRMAPLIPDERISSEEHLGRYAKTLAGLGVDFVEIMPLRVHRGIQSESENPAFQRILPNLDTALFYGNQRSIPLDQLKEIGLHIRDCFSAHGVRYSSGHILGRFAPFGDDVFSACHCADLEEVGGPFEHYYKATFAQLGLEAKRLWDKHRIPVLIQRSDLDRYDYPPDKYIFPDRSKSQQLPYEALLDIWWVDVGGWLWVPPYFWELNYENLHKPELDYDSQYGLLTYFYDPHASFMETMEAVEKRRKVYAERACMLLCGKKVPFPEDRLDHDFWKARRTAFHQSEKGIRYPKERR